MATSHDALDDVFACLEWSRPILLVRPSRAERLVALGEALTRMPGRRLRELDPQDRSTLLKLTQEVGRLAARLEGISSESDMEDQGERLAASSLSYRAMSHDAQNQRRHARPPLPDPRLVRQIIAQRRLRDELLGAELFADPAWDMLLDLTAARAEHKRVSASTLCIAAAVPATMALR
ncbi:hypothetical protein GRI58_01300 [Porphyrobacter algicida]|uniref:Uncharacterized protein n=1 Tax=Qipengyuania algicida TaxID=1836209 RepID=A0A845ADA1_9SPHN|nr:hypothetical protein [Qipengyuania algicida]MXP27457.1 hypothetical protein [Qipengyuania algicida]